MVDKIDKPDAPSPYAIGSATQANRERPREEKKREDRGGFEQETNSLYREKFQGEVGVSKTIKVPIQQIDRLLFRRATPHHGTPTAEANLIWKDGRTTEGVNFLIHNWQDFLKIKNLKQGENIPAPFWQGGTHLEITIFKPGGTSGSWNLREMQRQHEEKRVKEAQHSWLREWGETLLLIDAKTGQIRPGMASIYFLGLLAFFLLNVWFWSKR